MTTINFAKYRIDTGEIVQLGTVMSWDFAIQPIESGEAIVPVPYNIEDISQETHVWRDGAIRLKLPMIEG